MNKKCKSVIVNKQNIWCSYDSSISCLDRSSALNHHISRRWKNRLRQKDWFLVCYGISQNFVFHGLVAIATYASRNNLNTIQRQRLPTLMTKYVSQETCIYFGSLNCFFKRFCPKKRHSCFHVNRDELQTAGSLKRSSGFQNDLRRVERSPIAAHGLLKKK